jgi:AraC-like DNA-binding protein
MELVLNFAGAFEQIGDGGKHVRQPRTLFVGELRRPVTTRPTGIVDLLGVRFRPGAASVFLDAPVQEIVDSMVDESPLDELFAHRVRAVHGADPQDRVALLQGALVDRVRNRRADDVSVRAAVKELVDHEGCLGVDLLAQKMGMNRRSLERRFVEEIGVAPKSLANVLRFRRVLRAVEEHSVDWAGIAIDCGYYDQSHLIRDFKRFTGRTPRAYLREDHPLTALLDGSASSVP